MAVHPGKEVINAAAEFLSSIETRNELHSCMTLQRPETTDETPIQCRVGRKRRESIESPR